MFPNHYPSQSIPFHSCIHIQVSLSITRPKTLIIQIYIHIHIQELKSQFEYHWKFDRNKNLLWERAKQKSDTSFIVFPKIPARIRFGLLDVMIIRHCLSEFIFQKWRAILMVLIFYHYTSKMSGITSILRRLKHFTFHRVIYLW